MKKLVLVIILLLLYGCTHRFPTVEQAIQTSDDWWRSIRTENPHYYKIVKLCNINIYLCGSRAKLWLEYNKLYPNTPFDLSSNTYMFTSHDPNRNLIEMWLVVKVINNKVLLHKWAVGHEFVRLLSIQLEDLLDVNDY